jgi:hypothetical protein
MAWIWRLVLVALVAGLAVINAAGVYAQLVAAHVEQLGNATAAVETQEATLDARIDMASPTLPTLIAVWGKSTSRSRRQRSGANQCGALCHRRPAQSACGHRGRPQAGSRGVGRPANRTCQRCPYRKATRHGFRVNAHLSCSSSSK